MAMTKTIELLKKTTGTLVAVVFVMGLLFVVSCDSDSDDPGPELYDLSGFYTFKKAVLTAGKEDIADVLNLPATLIPSDITVPMSDGLLAEAPCDDSENGAVELKSDKKLFFSCLGEENEAQAGTWTVNSDTTELTLNLSVSTGNLSLEITELYINETTDVIGGNISNFPITKTLLAGFLAGVPGGDVILASIDDNVTILVDVEIEFQKVEE